MTTNTIYELVARAIQENITEPWTIAQLTVQFFPSSQEAEFEGTYLDASGEAQPLSTDFSDEVAEAMPQLFISREAAGRPRANQLVISLSAKRQLTTEYSWDQEIQDEDDHFSNGGTARDWMQIRQARYGSLPE